MESYGIPLQQVARVIAYDGNINNVEEEFVNDIIPVEKLKTVYTPQLVDSIKWNEDFNDNFFENHKKEFLKVWFSLFKKKSKNIFRILVFEYIWILESKYLVFELFSS